MPAHIVMPEISAPNKIAATRGYGGNVVFSGSTAAEREAVAARVVAATGARLVPPYDHPDIILGQGTMGLELQEQVAHMKATAANASSGPTISPCTFHAGADPPPAAPAPAPARPPLDAILTPCGGGGMLAGVALAAEGTGTAVFGAEPWFEGADDAARGFAAGARVAAVASRTIADGLRTPLGRHNWAVVYERRLVRDVYAVGEDDIRAAMRLVLERAKMVVEPSAAVPLAVALFNEDFRALVEREGGAAGWDLGIVLSGGNVSVETIGKLFAAA